MRKERTIQELEEVLEDALQLVAKTLAHAKRSFYSGICVGIGITSSIVLLAQWYYS